MVPAESILNLESRLLFFTKSLKTPSAAGLLHMLPRQTKRTEKGFVLESVAAADGVEAIVALIIRFNGFFLFCKLFMGLSRNGNFFGSGGNSWDFGGGRRRVGEEWQYGNFGVVEAAANDV